jgi:dUTPase
MSSYRLELLVSDSEKALYSTIATENRSNDNAGVDLFIVAETTLTAEKPIALLDLGVKARMVRLSDGEEVHYWLAPRSSIFKSNVHQVNSLGVIDRTYRGTLMGAVRGLDSSQYPTTLLAGIRLFQILAPDMGHIKEVRLVNSLAETSRGSGGFGSTGL